MRGSRSGKWERVEAARWQARLALGRDPNSADLYDAPPKRKSQLPASPEPVRVATDPAATEYVLTTGEVAIRFNMDRRELEAMIARGEIATVQGEFILMIPTREVERLRRLRLETP